MRRTSSPRSTLAFDSVQHLTTLRRPPRGRISGGRSSEFYGSPGESLGLLVTGCKTGVRSLDGAASEFRDRHLDGLTSLDAEVATADRFRPVKQGSTTGMRVGMVEYFGRFAWHASAI